MSVIECVTTHLLFECYIGIIGTCDVIVKNYFEDYRLDSPALDLLNSDWRDYRGSGRHEDRLDSAEWVSGFVSRWGFSEAGTLSNATISKLRALRGVLQRIVDSLVAGESPSEGDIAAMNDALAACPQRRLLVREGTGFRVDYAPDGRDWNWVRAEIAASFAEMLAEHDPRRIKMCENDNCRWVFCDESKSRSRRWCEDTCGNLVKVRRFRQRRRAEAARPAK